MNIERRMESYANGFPLLLVMLAPSGLVSFRVVMAAVNVTSHVGAVISAARRVDKQIEVIIPHLGVETT